MWSKIAAAAACLAALLAQGGAVHAADVEVIASTAMREVLDELVPHIRARERPQGHGDLPVRGGAAWESKGGRAG